MFEADVEKGEMRGKGGNKGKEEGDGEEGDGALVWKKERRGWVGGRKGEGSVLIASG